MMAEGYLGEFPVSIPDSIYADWTRETWALSFIERYGQIDGDHHRAWVLDQVARILLGTPVSVVEARWTTCEPEHRISTGEPSQAYRDWLDEMFAGDGYDAGIAP